MVQVIERTPSLGELLGAGISTGVQTGLQEKLKQFGEERLLKQKQEERAKQGEAVAGALQHILGGESTGTISKEEASSLGASLTPENILKLGEISQKREKELERRKEFGHTATKTFREEMDRLTKSAPSQRLSLETMKDAIETGNIGAWSKDYMTDVLADMTGVESFRNLKTLKGSQFLSAQKSLFSDLRELFPGQIRTAELTLFGQFLPQLGRSKEANLAVLGLLEATQSMKEKRIEAYHKILDQTGGYAPSNISSLVDESTKGSQKQIMDNYRQQYLSVAPYIKGVKGTTFNEAQKIIKPIGEKALTEDLAKKILKAAGGDPDKAAEMAKRQGFKVD